MDDKFEDYYEVLGVPFGATKQEISKAFRAKAPLLHPDKHKDDPSAVKRFVLLGKAKDILTDDKARAAYDALVKVRLSQVERESKLDAERRRMIRELNERERQAKARTPEDLEKEARTQLAAEIERLKGEGVLKDYAKAYNKGEGGSDDKSIDGTLKFTFEKGAKRWRDRDAVERFMSAWGTVTGVVCKKTNGVVSFSRMNFDPELVPDLIATTAVSGGAPPLSATWIQKPTLCVQLEQKQPPPPPPPQQQQQQQQQQEREVDSAEIDLLEQNLFKKMMMSSESGDTSKEPLTKRPKN